MVVVERMALMKMVVATVPVTMGCDGNNGRAIVTVVVEAEEEMTAGGGAVATVVVAGGSCSGGDSGSGDGRVPSPGDATAVPIFMKLVTVKVAVKVAAAAFGWLYYRLEHAVHALYPFWWNLFP